MRLTPKTVVFAGVIALIVLVALDILLTGRFGLGHGFVGGGTHT